MRYSCFSCGYVFHKGMPPLEALSQGQATIVGVDDTPTRFTPLEGTPLQGLSTYNFCTYCLVVVREFPTAYTHKSDYYNEVQLNRPSRRVDLYGYHSFNWVWANRMMLLLAAKRIYKNGDFSTLEALLDPERG